MNGLANRRPSVPIYLLVAILMIASIGRLADAVTQAAFDGEVIHGGANPPSSSLAISSDGGLLVAANPDSNSISLVDAHLRVLVTEIPVGVDPRSVALSSDGTTAYVANQGSDTVSVVDLAAREVVATIQVGDRPVGVALSPNGKYLAVSEAGADQVRLIDPQNLATRSVHPTGDRPYGLAFTLDSRHLLITHLLSGDVSLLTVDPFTFYLPSIISGFSMGFLSERIGTLNPYTGHLNLEKTIPTWNNVAPAPSVVVNTAGSRAYLPQTMANGLGFNTAFDTTVFPKVSVLNLATMAHQTAEHISLPETDRPVGLPWAAALTRGDTELWVVNAASNDVSVVDISTASQPRRAANVPVGDKPTGIVFSPDGGQAFVNNSLSGTLSVIDTGAYTVTDVITTTQIPLPPTLLHGKRLFFSSASPDLALASWISCNTCHIEGEQDGRTWLLNFLGEVPPGEQPIIRRNTTSLLGMIETYPLRWSAEWDESADSEFSIRFEQFGRGLIDGDMHPTLGDPNQGRSYDLDCLAAFIDSLHVPARQHTLTPAEQRGKLIFESPETGCRDCHPAPLYTDLQVHDVGTAGGDGEWFGPQIDTPTLRFLYDSAPYLHDGSAGTLADVLTSANPGDEHGVTSHLTQGELDDLITYLLTIPYQ